MAWSTWSDAVRPKRASHACGIRSALLIVPVASSSAIRAPTTFDSVNVIVSPSSSCASSVTATLTVLRVCPAANVSVPDGGGVILDLPRRCRRSSPSPPSRAACLVSVKRHHEVKRRRCDLRSQLTSATDNAAKPGTETSVPPSSIRPSDVHTAWVSVQTLVPRSVSVTSSLPEGVTVSCHRRFSALPVRRTRCARSIDPPVTSKR